MDDGCLSLTDAVYVSVGDIGVMIVYSLGFVVAGGYLYMAINREIPLSDNITSAPSVHFGSTVAGRTREGAQLRMRTVFVCCFGPERLPCHGSKKGSMERLFTARAVMPGPLCTVRLRASSSKLQ